MAKACSTAGVPSDILAGYKRKKSTATKLKYIETQLDPAIRNTPAFKHMQLVNRINEVYPGYVDQDDNPLAVDQFLPTPTGPAVATQQELFQSEETGNAKPKAEKKARSKKPSPAAVATKEQPKSPTPATERAAADPVVTKGSALKKGGAKKASKPKKSSEETGKSEPVREPKPQPAKREEQQPANIAKAAAQRKTEDEVLAAQVAKENLPLPEQLADAIRDLEGPSNTQVWRDAAAVIFEIALVSPKEGIKTATATGKITNEANAAAFDAATEMVNNRGPNAELLWRPSNDTNSKNILLGWIEDSVLSRSASSVSDSTFKTHIRLWNAAITHKVFPLALRSVTTPRQKVKPVFPKLTPSMEYLKEHMPRSYNWEKHGGTNEQENVTPETQPDTAEDISNYNQNYEAINDTGTETGIDINENMSDDQIAALNTSDNIDNEYQDFDMYDETGISNPKIFDSNTGKPITKPISMGVAKMLVSKFMARLYNKSIKHRVYKNVEEFKRKDPALYDQVTATRSDKKPIPNNAAGYAFKTSGNAGQVLIFTDNIATKAQLNFTIAHEVIGHFGLGSIMPTENFNKLLDDVYAKDSKIRQAVDFMMEMRGLDKREATEEALADAAANLDNSLIARIADLVKRFFRRLGVRFDDDMTRYFLRHSRIYQRTGRTPDSSPYAVMREFKVMDTLAGRASATQFDHNNEAIRNTQGGGYQSMPSRFKSFLNGISSTDGALKRASNVGKTTARWLENIQSFDNLALRSRPLRELFKIMTMQKQRLEKLKTELSEIMEWSNKSRRIEDALRKVGIGNETKDIDRAPTDVERRHAAIASVWRNRMKADSITESSLENAADIGVIVDGKMEIDREGGFKSNRDLGYMSLANINKGFKVQEIDNNGNPAFVKDANGKDQYYNDKGEVVTETGKDANGNEVRFGKRKKKMRFEPLVDRDGKPFTLSEREFKLMEEQRLATDTIAAHVYVDKVNGMMEEHNAYFMQLQSEQDLAASEVEVLKKVYKVYTKLYNDGAKIEGSGMRWRPSSIARAKAFSYNVTRILNTKSGSEKIKDWEQGRDADTMGDFLSPESGTHKARNSEGKLVDVKNGSHHAITKDVVAEVLAVAKAKAVTKSKRGTNSDKINTAIQNMYLMNTQVTNAELYAQNTIQSAYVPLRRDGKYQVKMSGFKRTTEIVNGKEVEVLTPVVLPELIQQQMFYTRMDSPNDAQAKADEIYNILKDKPAVEMLLPNDDTPSKIVFRATWSTAEQGASLSGSISYDDVANVLIRAGVNINPKDRERLVQLTASEHSTARSNLQKNWSPGFDPNIQHRVAEHLEQQAHIAAKNRHTHKVSRLMINESGNWSGDSVRLKTLQDNFLAVKAKGNEAATDVAYQEMAAFQWQHVSSAPTMGGGVKNIKTLARDGTATMVAGHNKGAQYQGRANAIIGGYHKNQGTPITGDEAFAEQGSWAMSGTALFHLGGSLAPALVNMTALATHSLNYLATMNSTNGYGGGHGYNAAGIALYKAGRDVSLLKDGLTDMTGSAKNIQKIIDNGNWTKYFESVEEAMFMRDLTAEGATTPNLFNSLSDVARSGNADSAITKVAEKWMILFAKSEQYNRRVTALASYRLDKQRLIEASGNPNHKLSAKERLTLHDRATDAVNYSQGNYDSFNRPSWAQGNVFKYLWMYKQFQVITVQLIRNMSHADRIKMIGMLILLSGLKGVPFMEDAWDFIDTLMQKFGIKWAGVEAEMTILLKDSPISSALVARGGIDHYFGFTGSTRFSMGDLIPGTGLLKAGSDLGRETESIFGPVWGAWKGGILSAATVAQYAAETIGLKDDVTSLSDVLKTGLGFSALKNYARGVTIMMDGAVTNDRGQVVAKNAGVYDAVTQMLGFYPAAATDQYAVIRMTNDARDYAQAIKSSYVHASLKAKSSKERSAIARAVREWNKDSRGGPFFIKNFAGAVSKARKSARMNAVGRNLKTVPTAMKRFGADLASSRGLDTKGIPLTN